jgi:hypothetical protein
LAHTTPKGSARLRRQEHRATRSASISSMPGAGARDSIQGIALADPGKTGVVRQCRQRLVQIVARYQRMLKRSAAISMSGRLERTCSKNIANCRRKKRGVRYGTPGRAKRTEHRKRAR